MYFVTRRKLDTGDSGEDYLIPLDEEIDMVFGMRVRDSKWKNHDFKGQFRMTFASKYGNALIPSDDIEKPQSRIAITTETGEVKELNCLKQEWDEFKLDSCYDPATQELVFRAEVPDNSWFSIGFGSSMSNTDMIGWFVKNKKGKT